MGANWIERCPPVRRGTKVSHWVTITVTTMRTRIQKTTDVTKARRTWSCPRSDSTNALTKVADEHDLPAATRQLNDILATAGR